MNYVKNAVVECAPMKDETILYDPRTVRFCVLNASASFVWERLATPRSAGDLLAEISSEYRVDDTAAAERGVQSVLAELQQLSFVDAIDGVATNPPSNSEQHREPAARPVFAAPGLRVMDESEVLAQFQVTSAGATWWAT
jgi:hypothetical protein